MIKKILTERVRQDARWGEQNHDDFTWSVILGEEVGEVCQAILADDTEQVEKELVQVAAVAVAWLECIERREVFTE